MKSDSLVLKWSSFGVVSALVLVGMTVLVVRLRTEQLEHAAEHRLAMARQSSRCVQTAGLRGRIFARGGEPLAINRLVRCIEVYPEAFRPRRKGETLEANLSAGIEALEALLGRPHTVSTNAIARHLRYELARPLTLWRALTDEELARFCEHQGEHPGFDCVSEAERVYPQGSIAAHVIGYVGRDNVRAVTGDRKVNFSEKEPFGREGLEGQYDDYLRSMPGEERVIVDNRGFATSCETLVKPRNGCDLQLTLDLPLQRAVEAQLRGCRGACVALDPRDGAVLAMASAPSYNLNVTVPIFLESNYRRLRDDPDKPLLNRASNGRYAPGSTFKPITALAGLGAGWSGDRIVECEGSYAIGSHRIHCSRTWGHGALDLPHALRESCNPYFCTVGAKAGTKELQAMARRFGLGGRTGIDFPTDAIGIVPDAEWKKTKKNELWTLGDLAQMSIGQSFLEVTPLQMARVVAALGTGVLVTPRLNAELPTQVRELPVPKAQLEVVREGMRMVVDGGTGRKAGLGVNAKVIGKTGTAEVGEGAARRKNTWFIAYATPTEESKVQAPIAIAMVIESGESGGGTTAPKVAEVLKAYYNEMGGAS